METGNYRKDLTEFLVSLNPEINFLGRVFRATTRDRNTAYSLVENMKEKSSFSAEKYKIYKGDILQAKHYIKDIESQACSILLLERKLRAGEIFYEIISLQDIFQGKPLRSTQFRNFWKAISRYRKAKEAAIKFEREQNSKDIQTTQKDN